MKRSSTFARMLILVLLAPAAAFAQSHAWSIAGAADYQIPVGGLSERFLPAVGFSLRIGIPTGTSAQWAAVVEYASFDRLNGDALTILRTVDVSGDPTAFEFPLEGLDMNLEFVGASADVRFRIIDAEVLRADIGLGFGMFRWFGSRGAVRDSLFADTTGSGTQDLIAVLNVPGVSQRDWSGGFSAGVDLEMPILSPVTLWAGARFKLIAGELWPTLDLDLENVSTFQMIDLKFGLRLEL